MKPPRTAAVVGNPKPNSRTLAATIHLTRELSGHDPDLVVDLTTLGAALLDWTSVEVAELVARVGHADLVVVGSPTYKGAYTGLLKLFLDRFEGGRGLRGVRRGPGHRKARGLCRILRAGQPAPDQRALRRASQPDAGPRHRGADPFAGNRLGVFPRDQAHRSVPRLQPLLRADLGPGADAVRVGERDPRRRGGGGRGGDRPAGRCGSA